MDRGINGKDHSFLLSPYCWSDQRQFFPNNIYTSSIEKVVRTSKIIVVWTLRKSCFFLRIDAYIMSGSFIAWQWGAYATTTVTATRTAKSNRFRQANQQLCTCVTLFCTFLCRRCTTTTWNCLISRLVEDENTRQQLSFSFPELWYSLLEFNSRKICQHLTN